MKKKPKKSKPILDSKPIADCCEGWRLINLGLKFTPNPPHDSGWGLINFNLGLK